MKTRGICSSTFREGNTPNEGIHKNPLVEDIFFIDIQEFQASTTSLILDFGCISFILVVCFVNSSNAISLHLSASALVLL
jgi:hypothetical protein